MLQFEDARNGRIQCGLPKGKQARVDFTFPLGWVPYVCCDETVISAASFDDLRTHVALLSMDPLAAGRFCPFFDPRAMACRHEATRKAPDNHRSAGA